ncbi:hypothetical protein FKP32DRAFT_1671935 [Trametes sanguinea]|nr:hypothetical protein FKP32DRAFT_1671935 [Trametes sanguinea]
MALLFTSTISHVASVALPIGPSILCAMPLISRLPLCAGSALGSERKTQDGAFPSPAALSGLTRVQGLSLDEFPGPSARGAALFSDIMTAELAVKDLVVAVKVSDMASKDMLVEALAGFIIDANDVGRSLQHLSAKLKGTFDSIGAFNSFAMRAIREAHGKNAANHILADANIAECIQSAHEALSTQVAMVMASATDLLTALAALDGRLTIIHEICIKDSLQTSAEYDDVLWELWSILGLNKDTIRGLRYKKTVLQDLTQYRSAAALYVSVTTHVLTAMEADLGDLRDRASLSRSGWNDIPMEVHLESIERIVTRLQQAYGTAYGRGTQGLHIEASSMAS